MQASLSKVRPWFNEQRAWWAGLDPVEAGFFVYAGLVGLTMIVGGISYLIWWT